MCRLLWKVLTSPYVVRVLSMMKTETNILSLINTLISSGYVSCLTGRKDNAGLCHSVEKKAKLQPEDTTIRIFLIKSLKLPKWNSQTLIPRYRSEFQIGIPCVVETETNFLGLITTFNICGYLGCLVLRIGNEFSLC